MQMMLSFKLIYARDVETTSNSGNQGFKRVCIVWRQMLPRDVQITLSRLLFSMKTQKIPACAQPHRKKHMRNINHIS
jgi:hypothetical protein